MNKINILSTACILSLLASCSGNDKSTTELSVATSNPASITGATPAIEGLENSANFADVDQSRIIAEASSGENWLSHGRTYDEQRFSPLTQINQDNVNQLGLAWFADFSTNRGQQSTPVVVDGVIYVTEVGSKVHAYDARSGSLLWLYDPQVPGEWLVNACCDAVNRGVALWQGKVFVGTADNRLVALDAETGAEVWSVATTPAGEPYAITGAPPGCQRQSLYWQWWR